MAASNGNGKGSEPRKVNLRVFDRHFVDTFKVRKPGRPGKTKYIYRHGLFMEKVATNEPLR